MKHPHDALVKWAFKQPRHAEGLLRAILDPRLTALLDWATLKVEDGSFVDPSLSHLHSDLVLSVVFAGQRAYVYALLEHQRAQEPRMPLRLGQYMFRLWDKLARDLGAAGLPPIVPIVLYNGATPWTAPLAFEEVIALSPPVKEALSPHIPHFRIRLVDLSGGRMDGVVESMLTSLGVVALWCLRVAWDDARFEAEIDRIQAALEEIAASPDANAALTALMRYLGATHPNMPTATLRKTIERASGPRAREVFVDVFADIREEGRHEGLHEGRVQTLMDLLANRFGPLSKAARARIRKADEATLRCWTRRVLEAKSVDDLLDEPPPAPVRSPRASSKRTSG